MKALDEVPPDVFGPAARGLQAHPGFAYLKMRYQQEIDELQVAINDEAKGGRETQMNKRALARMLLARPEVLTKDLFQRAKAKFDRDDKT